MADSPTAPKGSPNRQDPSTEIEDLVAKAIELAQVQGVANEKAAYFLCVRAILAAHLEGLSKERLQRARILSRGDVSLGLLAEFSRLPRDKGARGDGFEWAVHAAILDGNPSVVARVARAMAAASSGLLTQKPKSVIFGYERAKEPVFLQQFLEEIGPTARLLPGGPGRSAPFYEAIPEVVKGPRSALPDRFSLAWKADLFLSAPGSNNWLAATVKSVASDLESGDGLRVGIAIETPDIEADPLGKPTRLGGLQVAVLPDRDRFMYIFRQSYLAVADALRRLGQHGEDWGPYYAGPDMFAIEVSSELQKRHRSTVAEVIDALDVYAQSGLIVERTRGFQLPGWLRGGRVDPPRVYGRSIDFGELFRR